MIGRISILERGSASRRDAANAHIFAPAARFYSTLLPSKNGANSKKTKLSVLTYSSLQASRDWRPFAPSPDDEVHGKKGGNPNHLFVALTHSEQRMERTNKCQEIQGVFNHP